MIWNMNVLTIFISIIFIFLVAIELGFLLGRRNEEKTGEETMKWHVNVLQNALLGLLALLIGFTFSMAITRYDLRKEHIVEETNAINTLYLRGQYLPAPQNEKVPELTKSYLAERINFYKAGVDTALIKQSYDKTKQLQKQLWGQALIAARTDAHPELVSLFVQSVNEVLDTSEKRLDGFENHVPVAVIILLFSVSSFAMGFVGYGYGISGKRRHGSTAAFALLIAIVLTIVLDIDRSRQGFIQVNQSSLLRLQEELH